MKPSRPAEEYVCTQCYATMKNWQQFEEYQHVDCGGLVKLHVEMERDTLVAEVSRIQNSPKFTHDQRGHVIELCHELINRAMLNERYIAENDLPSYSTSHRLQESALRALLDERDRLADRVWQLEKALELARKP